VAKPTELARQSASPDLASPGIAEIPYPYPAATSVHHWWGCGNICARDRSSEPRPNPPDQLARRYRLAGDRDETAKDAGTSAIGFARRILPADARHCAIATGVLRSSERSIAQEVTMITAGDLPPRVDQASMCCGVEGAASTCFTYGLKR
jgi:hypothetical protein